MWLALQVTPLPFLAVYAADPLAAVDAPRAVIESDGRVPRVCAVCAAAAARGIRPGLTLAAALALASDLVVKTRDARREHALLSALATACGAFTPCVSLEPPDAVLLEVRGSLRLFGGPAALVRAVQARAHAAGALRVAVGLAPTPLAALVFARVAAASPAPVRPAGTATPSLPSLEIAPVLEARHLVGALAPLPLAALRWPAERLERLATLGVRTIGAALRLPRAGFARRFGPAALLALDRLVGRAPEPRAWFKPGVRFAARGELLHELTEQAAILRACEPLCVQLEQFLRERQCGITSFTVVLHHAAPAYARHDRRAVTRLQLRLAEATWV
ncbi:MAG: DNA polymerase Y family protein, partial [Gammaproteobacteria bacterium]|nr:DNA polymerase Y family protein [Gammaproteobacteria bacterium]